ncbi:hypothetical protein L2Y90_24070 [Burkholderia pyrrocinia]|uniref:DUF5677 domain-containing protein n=1 Tax=Burkholderia pyrrocinia TaxID=60550 RepID=UPI00215B6713|nr:DUF5677 domain-containing protein [Burkholderia pyrrocinia]UVE69794.1 hypothetical protein L2Y90_24070 [Burkholderia pyrrocinia]
MPKNDTLPLAPIASSDPLKVIRSTPLVEIPLNKITIRDDIPDDPIFDSMYIAFLRGKTNVHYTRVSISKIRRGFWQPCASGFNLIEENIERKNINYIKSLISSGNRLSLFIYENQNKTDNYQYICSDDLPVHAAYEELGITVVPVVLMGKPKNLEESAFTVRSIPVGNGEVTASVEGATPVLRDSFQNILQSPNLPLSDALLGLSKEIERTKIDLRLFHKNSSDAIHYHHSLYSVLVRAKEQIDSIRIISENGNLMVAASLLRPLHELALVFYIDWLMPSHIYKYLQLTSLMSLNEWEKRCEAERKGLISSGTSKNSAARIKSANVNMFRLCSTVSEKARIFPYGNEYHKGIYSFLSDMIHHDFSMTARYLDTMEHGDNSVFIGNVSKTIQHIAHGTISLIISRIRSDIGIAQSSKNN